jgi:hypothetical protein
VPSANPFSHTAPGTPGFRLPVIGCWFVVPGVVSPTPFYTILAAVIPSIAGIQVEKDWIPDQVRNENVKPLLNSGLQI